MIFKRIKHLTYRLNLSSSWKIHLIINITYLKSVSNKNDFFKRQFHESDSITFDENNSDDSNDFESLFEIKKFLIKKIWIIQEKTKIKYLVKMTWLRIRTQLMI